MSDAPSQLWLIQRDYGHEGHGDIAAIADAEEAEAIVRELNAREGGGFTLESVPVFADLATARISEYTIRQQILRGGQLGDYQELHKTVWAFDRHEQTTVLGHSTWFEVTVIGYDRDEVLAAFTEALGQAQERAVKEWPQSDG